MIGPYDILSFIHLLAFAMWVACHFGQYWGGQLGNDGDEDWPARLAGFRLGAITEMGAGFSILVLATSGFWLLVTEGAGSIGIFIALLVQIAAVTWALILALPLLGQLPIFQSSAFGQYMELHQTHLGNGAIFALISLSLGTGFLSILGIGPFVLDWRGLKIIIIGLCLVAEFFARAEAAKRNSAIAAFLSAPSPHDEIGPDDAYRPILASVPNLTKYIWLAILLLMVAAAWLGNVKMDI